MRAAMDRRLVRRGSPRARRSRRATLLASVLVAGSLAPGPVLAADLLVPWSHATISAALAAAQAGDRVLVWPGTYSDTGGESFPLEIDEDVELVSVRVAEAVIDAEQTAPAIELDTATGGRVSGFRITGGWANNPNAGGGIRILSGSPEVDYNLIHDNKAKTRGSGIYVASSAAPWIHHNLLFRNETINLSQGEPHGVDLLGAGVFEHNTVSRHDSNGLLIEGNTPNLVVRHNIFAENGTEATSPDRGRGICHFGHDSTEISHNLFYDNVVASLLIDGIPGSDDVDAQQANDVDPGDGIYGNLDGDPRLAVPGGSSPPAVQDAGLLAGSAAIDAGNPLLPLDPDGSTADPGAFYDDMFSLPDADGDFVPDADDNCPNDYNVAQLDADADGIGDRCDAPCDDGVDNDGDGRIDHDPLTIADAPSYAAGSGDPGCFTLGSPREDPECQDGIDNDGQTGTDFDAGVSAADPPNPPDPSGADPQCDVPWRNCEKDSCGCGLGVELALVLPPLLALHGRRRARERSRGPASG